MPIVIFPVYMYFYMKVKNSRIDIFLSFLSFLLALSIVSVFLYTQGTFYDTSLNDVIFRWVSAMFGINIVVLNFLDYFSVPGVVALEKLSHVYQFLVMMFMYLLIIKSNFKMHAFIFPFLLVVILLSILYGSYLGYFVARTKFLILWLAIIFIGLQLSKYYGGSYLVMSVSRQTQLDRLT